MKIFVSRLLTGLITGAMLAACASGPRIDRSLSTPDQRSRVKYLVPALPDIAWFQRKLAEIGYLVPQDGLFNQATRNVLIAYQTRYRPSKIDGEPDAETAAVLDSPMQVKSTIKRGSL
jgi:N-acetyl-anhydromuramyl-L-alanine amidase AmpD